MNVNVGSFSNPEGLEGLAHFLGSVLHLHTFFWWIHVAIYMFLKSITVSFERLPQTSNSSTRWSIISHSTGHMIEVTGKEAHWLTIEDLSPISTLTNKACIAEHMLFYSNRKYPEEGAYLKFLAEVFLPSLSVWSLKIHIWSWRN